MPLGPVVKLIGVPDFDFPASTSWSYSVIPYLTMSTSVSSDICEASGPDSGEKKVSKCVRNARIVVSLLAVSSKLEWKSSDLGVATRVLTSWLSAKSMTSDRSLP